jgi:hypothetical protein
VNSIITAFWMLLAEEAWFPIFQYVKFELNINDKVNRYEIEFIIDG